VAIFVFCKIEFNNQTTLAFYNDKLNKDTLKKNYLAAGPWILVLFALLWVEASGQFYYGTRMEFGKNRVQYQPFDWTYYRLDLYDVYFYKGNDELAEMVARMAQRERASVEDFLDAPNDQRIQILVFNNLSDLKQSNLNLSDEDAYNTVGITRATGNRLFLHFNGSYSDLRTELRRGLAEMTLMNMIGGDFTQNLANSTLMNLPEWYTAGLISYMGESWNADLDNRVRDGLYTESYKKINTLTGESARIAGHSLWYYISQKYGRKVIKNIVYMSVLNRNIENGFVYILGVSLEDVMKGWQEFYRSRYRLSATTSYFEEKPIIKAPRHHRITQMALSPDGRYLAYVQQRFSRYKLFIHDLEKGKNRRILTGGYRIAQNADYSFPLLAWHPNGELLAFITEEKGFVRLNFYNREDKELKQKTLFQFDKVTHFEYAQNGRQLVLSAHKNGQSDIFIYTILNTKVEQVTKDNYDDRHPTFIMGDRRVAFSSNRTRDTLFPDEKITRFTNHQLDLFSAPAAELKDTTPLWRMTQSRGIDEGRLQHYQPGLVSFLSSRNGRNNQHLLRIDSSIAYVDTIVHYAYDFSEFQATNFDVGILAQGHHQRSGYSYDLLLLDGRYQVHRRPFTDLVSATPVDLPKRAQKPGTGLQPGNATDQPETAGNSSQVGNGAPLYYPGVNTETFEVDIYDYRFESEERSKDPEEEKKELLQQIMAPAEETAPLARANPAEEELEIPNRRQYFLTFFRDNFEVGFDAIFDNNQYQQFTGFVSSDLLNAGFNANFKVGALELMKDYRIVGGIQTSFQPLAGTSLAPNAEFLIGLADYRRRLDFNHTYYRRSQVQFLNTFDWRRIISNQVMTEATWPFSPVLSVSAALGLRHDRTINLSLEPNSLNAPDRTAMRAISRLSLVYDNSRKLALNIYSGLRVKAFTEYYRNLDISPSGLHTAGFDARYYQVLHRNLIWANRVAYGLSFGPEQLIYIMGGVDNAFGPDLEPTTPIAQENNYVFQTLATNMRGFFQNVRNGNQFAVINSEIRWPFLSYLIQKPMRSDFFKNLQVVGFTDIGTAWNGPTPWSNENAINTRTVRRGESLEIILDTQKDPIVYGYGAGVRSRLLGYFVRLDWAWGVEDGVILPMEFYVSLSTDF